MQNTVRTAYGAHLQQCQLLKLPIDIKTNSTLNEALTIFDTIKPTTDEMPDVKYAAIGIGGVKYTMVNGRPKIDLYQHKPTHAGLFEHLPFVLRLPSEDLPASERDNYRLRRLEEHDGIVYVAYYLRLLDKSSTIPQLEMRKVENNTTTSTTFNPTLSDLHPVPSILYTGDSETVLDNVAYSVNGNYVAATAKVPFKMDQNDIDEFLNVCNIIFGDDSMSVITEVALCSGVERVLNGDFNGVTIPYREAIAVQVNAFVAVHYAMKFIRREVDIEFDIGSVEPLLDLV